MRVEQEIDSGHILTLPYSSRCNRLHGHRWRVVVTISCSSLDSNGLCVDFTHVKEVIKGLDHCMFVSAKEQSMPSVLRQVKGPGIVYLPFAPTAENLAKYILEFLDLRLKENPVYRDRSGDFTITAVEVWETATGMVRYEP